MKQFDDGNIQIQYSDENEPCVLELMNQVLIAYETITSLFKLKNYDRKIIIQLYNSVEELHKEVFGKKREEWEVALECEDGTLKLVTPFCLIISLAWIAIILLWYISGLPIGPDVYPTL